MISSFNISLSGLNAASKRLEVSASNVANQSSTSVSVDGQVANRPYAAKRVDQVSNPLGGVGTIVRDKDPATIKIFNPNLPNADANGTAEVPNVSLEEELINQIALTYDYKANLKAIKTANEMQKSLLDIKS